MLYNLTENKIKKYNTMSYKNENDIIETIRKLDEDYDYTELMHIFKTNENFKKEFDVGAAANDVAFFSSYLGAIKPYHVTVDFYTTR